MTYWTRHVAHALVAVGAVMWVVAIVGWRHRAPISEMEEGRSRAAVAPLVVPTDTALDSALDVVLAGDPFRLAQSTAVASSVVPPGALPPVRFRPALVLSGVVGGPPWSAVIEGVPGREGPWVARAGDRFGELTVKRVARDTVVIVASDTTWRLTLRRFQ